MAYDPVLICRCLEDHLARAPRLRLSQLAAGLGVDRHTITRALASSGQSFRAMQEEATRTAMERLAAADPPRSGKMLAEELGFSSPVALAHYRRRHK
ncbi:MAG TPA: hypothetical protein VFP94_05705 [Terriglobales bacterium]|nr:hypothetical protein [Terriglobales bacterium]